MKPRHLILTLLCSAVLAACSTTTSGSMTTGGAARSQLLLVSPEEVMQESLKYYQAQNADARKKGKLITSGPEFNRVNAVMNRLVPHVASFRPDAAQWPWELVLLDEDNINAYVMAGGKITFYTGIIRRLNLTDAEIAAIMGHEMAHALREHTREKMSQSALSDLVISIGSSMLGGGSELAGLGKTLALDLPFSRKMETEADLYGLELAARAGYNPNAAVTLWQKMAQLDGGGSGSFLSTHPTSSARIQTLQNAVPQVMPLYQKAPVKTGAWYRLSSHRFG